MKQRKIAVSILIGIAVLFVVAFGLELAVPQMNSTLRIYLASVVGAATIAAIQIRQKDQHQDRRR